MDLIEGEMSYWKSNAAYKQAISRRYIPSHAIRLFLLLVFSLRDVAIMVIIVDIVLVLYI